MARWTLLLGLTLLAASCSKGEDSTRSVKPGAAAPSSFVLEVDGMQRGEGGKTWMAWPESVKRALEGLAGVKQVEMDLDRDLFRITLAAQAAPSEAALLEAIRNLGYTPAVVDATTFREGREPVHATGEPPEPIKKAIDRAKAEKKRFVLVDCMGDTWVACKRMSVQTFADPEVKKLIEEHFVFVELDVDHEREAAGWFAGAAIPDTWILGPDGRMLDRVVGFMAPKEFAARLRNVVEGK